MAAVPWAAFKPEFINRLDDIVVFDALDSEQLESIVDIQLAALGERLADRRLTLDVTDAAQGVAGHADSTRVYGARPLRRLVQRRSATSWPGPCWPARSATATWSR